jgi:aryl-alcohol dehydrogenase-like predicted oxidoreductase
MFITDFDILEVVIQIANEKDVKPAQIALAWSLEKNITYKNSIKANSSKIVSFEYTLKKDDIVKVKLYYHKIREEIAKKVNFKSKKDNVKLFKERVFKGDL